jgi:hypothetical protein
MTQVRDQRLRTFQLQFMRDLPHYRPPCLTERFHAYWACPECCLPRELATHTTCQGGDTHATTYP